MIEQLQRSNLTFLIKEQGSFILEYRWDHGDYFDINPLLFLVLDVV